MAVDYEKIRDNNLIKYGTSTHHLELLSKLYTDRTHFIFELIQNAEDANASIIEFNLFNDRLEVSHDGRLFDEKDVLGVSGFAEGTKSEDLNQIGKFGIGFNSVYAYTATPEIHSGEESFKIEEYVRPRGVSSKKIYKKFTTLFVFPFNLKEITQTKAFHEIGDRLRNLNFRTLLFLKKITTIKYFINENDVEEGWYHRMEQSFGSGYKISIIGYNLENEGEEDWLVFKRLIPNQTDRLYVEVGFRLLCDNEGKDYINPDKNTPLVVFFPTEKETKLGFLIQGPYRTTPARDNIPKDNEWNKKLIYETAMLLKEVLPEIKKLGLLTVSFLKALPIRSEDFPEGGMFYPFYKVVKESFQEMELIPCDDGTYAAYNNAILARGSDLISLINNSELKALFKSKHNLKWITGEVTENNTPELHSYFINEIGIKEIRANDFAEKIHRDFLEKQPDDWFIEFYKFLSHDRHKSLWNYRGYSRGILRTKPIIRLEGGEQNNPFLEDHITPKVFLPPNGESDYPIVSPIIVEDVVAKSFLEELGLSKPSLFDDIISKIYPKYSNPSRNQITETEHQKDIKTIIHALGTIHEEKKQKLFNEGKKYKFLKAVNNLTGEIMFKKPGEVYEKTPDLKHYFSNNCEVWFLHEDYEKYENNIWYDFDVNNLPRIIPVLNVYHGEKEHATGYEEIENRDLEGLKNFLDRITQQAQEDQEIDAYILWDFLKKHLEKDEDFFKGTYRWFYRTHRIKKFDSLFLEELKKYKWIPTKSGEIVRPEEVEASEILEDFYADSELIKALGIKGSKSSLIEKYGVDLDDLEFIKENFEEFKKFKEGKLRKTIKPPFPEKEVVDVDRREEKINEEIRIAKEKKYTSRNNVSTRITGNSIEVRQKLRNDYTNGGGQLICQICENEMPFRKRNGEHYFEIRELLSREFLPLEIEAQFLALCPVCAAKYTEFVINDGSNKMTTLKENIINSLDNKVPIELDVESEINFVETHLFDLQKILQSKD